MNNNNTTNHHQQKQQHSFSTANIDKRSSRSELKELLNYYILFLRNRKDSDKSKFLKYDILIDGMPFMNGASEPDLILNVLNSVSKFTNEITIKIYKYATHQNYDQIKIKLEEDLNGKPQQQDVALQGLAGLGSLGLDGLGSKNIDELLSKKTEFEMLKRDFEEVSRKLSETLFENERLEEEIEKAEKDVEKYQEKCEEVEQDYKAYKQNNQLQLLGGISMFAEKFGIPQKLGLLVNPNVDMNSLGSLPISDDDKARIEWANEIEANLGENLNDFNELVNVLCENPQSIKKILQQLNQK